MPAAERLTLLAVETGGTKIVARLAGPDFDETCRWPTSTPDRAVQDICGFVESRAPQTSVAAAGLAAFGPLLLAGEDAGLMLATSKPGWEGSNLRRVLGERLGCEVKVDSDVNAAALAELALEPAGTSLAYVTIGTGIGAGLATPAGTLRGALHPEMGHLRLVREPGDDHPGSCPFHADCAEGLASGPAVQSRLGGRTLEKDPAALLRTAGYIAQLLEAIVLAWSPHRIAVGGGLGTAAGLFDAIDSAFRRRLGAYGLGPAVRDPGFLRPTRLADAGLHGAMLMARAAANFC